MHEPVIEIRTAAFLDPRNFLILFTLRKRPKQIVQPLFIDLIFLNDGLHPADVQTLYFCRRKGFVVKTELINTTIKGFAPIGCSATEVKS